MSDAGSSATQAVREKYDRRARWYDLSIGPMEMMGGKRLRGKLWSMVRGPRVLEVGVGTGRNMPFYPAGVRVTAVDFSPAMLARARARAESLGIADRVELREMDAQALDFPDGTFDSVAFTCVFCSVPDPVAGLKEVARVTKPEGRIVMLEHMRPERHEWMGRLFDRMNPWVYRSGGLNINRRTMENIARAGIGVESQELHFTDVLRLILAHPGTPERA